ncbi:MAG TPA: thioredoxin-disulfide reductase [Nitrospiraceae bacterium]|nr:thioredoxin-disulfide reductase [Nitrospiraceae bacterium]
MNVTDPVCNMEVDEKTAVTTECDGDISYFCSEGCKEKFLNGQICKLPRTSYDLIIIGGGPAGLTAAVYAATLKMDVFLIAKDLGGQAFDSTKIANYMGYDFITGPELIEKFQDQLIHSNYIDHLISEVEKIEPAEGGFIITTAELKKFFTKSVIIAAGMARRKLNVEGEETFQRMGVFSGNIQDLSFVQGEDVAVVGGGNSVLQMVENLQGVARNIHLVSVTELTADPSIIERLRGMHNVEIYELHKVVALKGDRTLSGVTIRKLAGETTVDLQVKGIFIAIGLQPSPILDSRMVNLNDRGEIMINPDCSTSYPGIFAAGDVTDAFGKRIVIASGEGAKAALAARQYIIDLRKRAA